MQSGPCGRRCGESGPLGAPGFAPLYPDAPRTHPGRTPDAPRTHGCMGAWVHGRTGAWVLCSVEWFADLESTIVCHPGIFTGAVGVVLAAFPNGVTHDKLSTVLSCGEPVSTRGACASLFQPRITHHADRGRT